MTCSKELAQRIYHEFVHEQKSRGRTILSGSAALAINGIKTRRKISDVDLYTEGPILIKCAKFKNISEDYAYDSGGEFNRVCYIHVETGIKVDVFSWSELSKTNCYTPDWTFVDLCPVMTTREIMSFKTIHGCSKSSTRWKHRLDVIYFWLFNK